MAFRLKLVPDNTSFNFFRWQWLTFGVSAAAMVGSVLVLLVMGLNFGIDFKGGTTIRTESPTAFEVGEYRQAMSDLDLGDVSITEVFDPSFGETKHVAMIRIGTTDETGSVTPAQLNEIEAALKTVDPQVAFAAVESVGPKVSGELIKTALYAVGAATIGIMFYIWLRFEWQFALGAVISLIHDVLLTVGLFSLFQLRFDLTTIAALLTTLGFSCNDTVVVFDRLRENLIKYKTRPLLDLMNLTCNETLSRTIMTAVTTGIALTAMLIFGGDVIRDFVIAMLWGVIVGCYSTIYVAKNIVLWLGVKRDWSKPGPSEKAPGEDIPAAFRDAP
ncbi:protein translocase subunit SecF [Paracoccus denitrificans]|jgi:preprotein translocase subunit SecF|uniref:Protein-export membrane protein SecF n=1 Tax=Paracoccus denitrificans (strain Pd 1222) TaxID=318586 RepID=A1B1X2_PARDP|nr:protein translocase subunit SecF [Paracoccus denitrificans]ABL69516.1 protein translocase subunit secF [Paracoccus denitrificans PD1222]MBB4626765.1 preprotein translocase subunit SecF [Paracoccus denitrificans]MCU7427752.1 protein translocase subunit SecF [Paracoccus denitrificans]QAR25009.1 protein translocase subunit SecF [Paracoccus denitrificans]UFS64818.1 protein translocase subunit SecF [Paracoccus denitrificans]